MSDLTTPVACERHGRGHATFVCSHLAQEVGVGYRHGPTDDPRPDAWCYDCDLRLLEAGEWTDENEAAAHIQLLCSGCYDVVRTRNSVTRPSLERDGFTIGTRDDVRVTTPQQLFPAPNRVLDAPRGSLLKALFLIRGEDASGQFIQGERMWVEVVRTTTEGVFGVLRSWPITKCALSSGQAVFCPLEAVLELDDGQGDA